MTVLRRLILLLLWTFIIFPYGTAGKERPDAYAEVLKSESYWEAANLHHDGAALTKVLLPEFVQINEDGTVMSRDEGIAKLQASGNRPSEYKVENRKIEIKGETAVLTAQYTEVGQSPKGHYRVVLKIADVFRYSQREWRGEVGYAHLVDVKSGQPNALPLNETH